MKTVLIIVIVAVFLGSICCAVEYFSKNFIKTTTTKKSETILIDQFGTDLTKMAKDDLLDSVVG